MWGRTGIAENAGGQSTECRDEMQQTPRTEDNDCDVGTYRQVRPTFPKRADLMTGTTVPIKEECPKTRRKKKTCVSRQRTHLIGTSLHPTSRKTPASGQRNAGIGHGEGGTQTPRTGDNDCDVGTYRQVRPTFPKRADLMTGTTVR